MSPPPSRLRYPGLERVGEILRPALVHTPCTLCSYASAGPQDEALPPLVVSSKSVQLPFHCRATRCGKRVSMRRILLVGLGSMGRRRIRLLQQFWPELELAGVDLQAERRAQTAQEFRIPVSGDLEVSLHDFRPDAVFTCSPPGTHAEAIVRAHARRCHTFSEIELDSADHRRILESAATHGRIAFLSSTMLYRREIQWLGERVCKLDQEGTSALYAFQVGQYLPDWHPWEDYRGFFASRRPTNGCREILGIHLPWILRVFGSLHSVEIRAARLTHLEIQFPDALVISCEHARGAIGSFLVDVVSRKPVFQLRLSTEAGHVQWDGTPQGLQELTPPNREMVSIGAYDQATQLAGYASHIIEDAYRGEIEAFLAVVEGDVSAARYTYQEDLLVQEAIDMIQARADASADAWMARRSSATEQARS